MDINLDRVLGRLEELYQCGAQEDGTFTRMAYSPEDRKGREIFMDYFRKLGIEPEMDAAGNRWNCELVPKQCVNIIAFDLQLVEDKGPDKVVFRLLDDVRRAAILGDGALVNDQHPVGKGEGLLRVMGDNDGG